MKIVSTTTVWPKWQIVIPKEIRNKLNIKPGDWMIILLKDDKYIWLVKNNEIDDLMKFINNEKK